MIANNTPLISIVIPCFNSEQYLSETLESCLQQTYPNWEIIVVDDGSTDASLKIARNYSHYYSGIEVISIENNGQCFARNLGMKKAQGEYIQFLDSDDLLAPQYLEEQLKVLNAYQADLSICGEICFTASNFSERKAKLNNQNKITISDCIYYDYFLDCIKSVSTSYNSILISKEKVLKVGGFEISSKAANEIILHFKLATQFPEIKAVYYPKKLLLKRVHENSISVCNRDLL
jgi:glycosyltransferase involved in cell wall biosynthesis